jgi:hypothetical protein
MYIQLASRSNFSLKCGSIRITAGWFPEEWNNNYVHETTTRKSPFCASSTVKDVDKGKDFIVINFVALSRMRLEISRYLESML